MIFLLIVTVSSMAVAAIMSVIAWRLAAAERRRSEARIAALSAEIHAPAVAGTGTGKIVRRAEIGLRAEPPRLTAVPQPRPLQRWDNDLPLGAGDSGRAASQMFATEPRDGGAQQSTAVKATRSMPSPRFSRNARAGALCSVGVSTPSNSM